MPSAIQRPKIDPIAPATGQYREEVLTQTADCLLIVTAEVDPAVEAEWNKWYDKVHLKDALASLRELERSCAAAEGRIAEAVSDNVRSEVMGLAAHAQEVGADASARVATMLGEVGSRVGERAASGLEAVRGASARLTLLASGVLAGVADALRDQSQTKTGD